MDPPQDGERAGSPDSVDGISDFVTINSQGSEISPSEADRPAEDGAAEDADEMRELELQRALKSSSVASSETLPGAPQAGESAHEDEDEDQDQDEDDTACGRSDGATTPTPMPEAIVFDSAEKEGYEDDTAMEQEDAQLVQRPKTDEADSVATPAATLQGESGCDELGELGEEKDAEYMEVEMEATPTTSTLSSTEEFSGDQGEYIDVLPATSLVGDLDSTGFTIGQGNGDDDDFGGIVDAGPRQFSSFQPSRTPLVALPALTHPNTNTEFPAQLFTREEVKKSRTIHRLPSGQYLLEQGSEGQAPIPADAVAVGEAEKMRIYDTLKHAVAYPYSTIYNIWGRTSVIKDRLKESPPKAAKQDKPAKADTGYGHTKHSSPKEYVVAAVSTKSGSGTSAVAAAIAQENVQPKCRHLCKLILKLRTGSSYRFSLKTKQMQKYKKIDHYDRERIPHILEEVYATCRSEDGSPGYSETEEVVVRITRPGCTAFDVIDFGSLQYHANPNTSEVLGRMIRNLPASRRPDHIIMVSNNPNEDLANVGIIDVVRNLNGGQYINEKHTRLSFVHTHIDNFNDVFGHQKRYLSEGNKLLLTLQPVTYFVSLSQEDDEPTERPAYVTSSFADEAKAASQAEDLMHEGTRFRYSDKVGMPMLLRRLTHLALLKQKPDFHALLSFGLLHSTMDTEAIKALGYPVFIPDADMCARNKEYERYRLDHPKLNSGVHGEWPVVSSEADVREAVSTQLVALQIDAFDAEKADLKAFVEGIVSEVEDAERRGRDRVEAAQTNAATEVEKRALQHLAQEVTQDLRRALLSAVDEGRLRGVAKDMLQHLVDAVTGDVSSVKLNRFRDLPAHILADHILDLMITHVLSKLQSIAHSTERECFPTEDTVFYCTDIGVNRGERRLVRSPAFRCVTGTLETKLGGFLEGVKDFDFLAAPLFDEHRLPIAEDDAVIERRMELLEAVHHYDREISDTQDVLRYIEHAHREDELRATDTVGSAFKARAEAAYPGDANHETRKLLGALAENNEGLETMPMSIEVTTPEQADLVFGILTRNTVVQDASISGCVFEAGCPNTRALISFLQNTLSTKEIRFTNCTFTGVDFTALYPTAIVLERIEFENCMVDDTTTASLDTLVTEADRRYPLTVSGN